MNLLEESLNHLNDLMKQTEITMKSSEKIFDEATKNLSKEKKEQINEFIKNNKSTDITYITKKVKQLLDADNNK